MAARLVPIQHHAHTVLHNGPHTLNNWAHHESQVTKCYKIYNQRSHPTTHAQIHNEDYILDTDIEIAEVEAATAKLKQGEPRWNPTRAHTVALSSSYAWLNMIINCMISHEAIPPFLKMQSLCPYLQLLTTSYRDSYIFHSPL